MSGSEHSSLDTAGIRKGIISLLSSIATHARQKYANESLSHQTRLPYGRLSVSAADALGKILNTVALEELENRISKLEELRK